MKYLIMVLVLFYCSLVFANNRLYVCWASPTKHPKCGDKCNGVGTYARHSKKEVAKKIALDECNKEFGNCKIDYCETM